MGRVVRLLLPLLFFFFFFFLMEGFQRERAQSWHGPRFPLRRPIGGFFMWGVPISWHVPRFYLLILADVVRFPSAFGPWWACHFLFFWVFFFVFFSRERYQSTRFPGVPPVHTTMRLPIQTGVSAPTAAVGDAFGSLCGPLIA